MVSFNIGMVVRPVMGEFETAAMSAILTSLLQLDFRPLPLLGNPHLQTVLGAFLPGRTCPLPRRRRGRRTPGARPAPLHPHQPADRPGALLRPDLPPAQPRLRAPVRPRPGPRRPPPPALLPRLAPLAPPPPPHPSPVRRHLHR